MSDQRAHDESAEPIDANEPTESTEHAEPRDPIDRNDPTDPMESTEPFEPIESNESSDQSDQRERDVVTRAVSRSERSVAAGDVRLNP